MNIDKNKVDMEGVETASTGLTGILERAGEGVLFTGLGLGGLQATGNIDGLSGDIAQGASFGLTGLGLYQIATTPQGGTGDGPDGDPKDPGEGDAPVSEIKAKTDISPINAIHRSPQPFPNKAQLIDGGKLDVNDDIPQGGAFTVRLRYSIINTSDQTVNARIAFFGESGDRIVPLITEPVTYDPTNQPDEIDEIVGPQNVVTVDINLAQEDLNRDWEFTLGVQSPDGDTQLATSKITNYELNAAGLPFV